MNIKRYAALLLLAASFGASATPTGPKIGNADIGDFTLNGQATDGIAFSTGNGQAGRDGNPGVFNSTFTGAWDLLTKIDGSGRGASSPINIAGSIFDITFSLGSDKKSGVWSITSSKDITLDLVLGMHAGNATASFLFDNEHLIAGLTEKGTFKIDWLNNGGQVPGYSNLTLFYRDAVLTPPKASEVPEPATYALMLAGLGIMGFAALRRKQARRC